MVQGNWKSIEGDKTLQRKLCVAKKYQLLNFPQCILFIYFVDGSIWRRINYENVQAYSTHERMKKKVVLFFTVACSFQHSFRISFSLRVNSLSLVPILSLILSLNDII